MGVIKRQGIKQSIVNYIGLAAAIVSTIFIYPLDRETYGLGQFLLGTSIFLLPFLSCGMHLVCLRYFPIFRDEDNGHNGLLGFITLVALLGWIAFAISFYFLESYFLKYLVANEDVTLFERYLKMLVPITFFMVFSQLYYYYCSVFKRIAWPSVFQNYIKYSQPVLLLLFFYGYISLDIFVWGLVGNYVLVFGSYLLYIRSLGELHFRINFGFFTSERLKDIGQYAAYSTLLSMNHALAFRIDVFMIPIFINFEDSGVYGISMFMGSAIAIPLGALIQIAAPIIAEDINKGDTEHLYYLYRESSLNLLLLGTYFFVGLVNCVGDVFLLMPNYELMLKGIDVVILVGIAKVVDMATGLNNQIINLSKHYRFGLWAVILMGAINVFFNFTLIPRMGITGAAIASLIAICLYNLVKLIFIYIKWKMQPFSINSLYILLLGGLIGTLIYVIPFPGGAILRVLQKGILITALYFSAAYYFKLSIEFNQLLEGGLKMLRSLLRPRS
ncbi:MAG: polysaccharide biosynthesis C-terminal domain-containing protein [Bacteroidota bacterium]